MDKIIRYKSTLIGLVVAFALTALTAASASAVNTVPTDVIKGKSVILTMPAAVARVSVADPEVLDVIPITSTEIQLNGLKIGNTTLIVWDKSGGRTFFDVNIIFDNTQLIERLGEIAPGDELTVKVAQNTVIVSGIVSTPDRLLSIEDLLKNYEKDEMKVVNLVEIGEFPQVLLQITVASIDRSASRDLGFNWSYASKYITLDSAVSSMTGGITDIGGLIQGAVSGGLSTSGISGATFSVVDWHNGTQYFLKALAGKGMAKILAEPNLLVKSGSTGKFLAGGEFPIPVVQSSSSGGNLPLTIVFKEFGVRMNFTPKVKESGLIELAMGRAPQPTTVITGEGTFTQIVDEGEEGIEVSSLDYANAIRIEGFLVPALKKDSVSTNVELKDGESFIIAGLINEEWSKNLDKLPLLGDIPILGAFFRDQKMTKSERELVFVVTPKLMKPMAPGERVENLPGSAEPTERQTDDLRWMPLLPSSHSLDPEQLK